MSTYALVIFTAPGVGFLLKLRSMFCNRTLVTIVLHVAWIINKSAATCAAFNEAVRANSLLVIDTTKLWLLIHTATLSIHSGTSANRRVWFERSAFRSTAVKVQCKIERSCIGTPAKVLGKIGRFSLPPLPTALGFQSVPSPGRIVDAYCHERLML